MILFLADALSCFRMHALSLMLERVQPDHRASTNRTIELLDSFIEYLELVEKIVKKLPRKQAFGFAFACVERQWPVYERSSLDKSWSTAGLRSSIDQAWQQLIDDQKMPGYLIERCRRSIPPDDVPGDSEVAGARLISNSAIDLLSALQGNESSYCHFPAARNIDLLEMLYEAFEGAEARHKVKPLLDLEIKRQRDDLVTMRVSSNVEQIAALRDTSMKISLFGDLWFPS